MIREKFRNLICLGPPARNPPVDIGGAAAAATSAITGIARRRSHVAPRGLAATGKRSVAVGTTAITATVDVRVPPKIASWEKIVSDTIATMDIVTRNKVVIGVRTCIPP